ELPGGPAVGAPLALPSQLEPRARVHTRWDLDAQLVRPPFDAGPAAGLTGIGDDRALPIAVTTRLGDREEALLEAHLPRAAALRAGPGSGARLGAVPATGLAGSQPGHGDGLLAAEGGFLEADLERVAQVLAAARPGTSAPPASGAEEVAEEIPHDVLEAGADVESAHPTLLEGGVTEAIVEPAPLGITENLVRLSQLLEALLGLAILGILVGMKTQRELAIGLLDLVVGGGARDPEHLVVVTLHQTRGALSPGRRMRAPPTCCTSPPQPKGRERGLFLDLLELGLDDVLLVLAIAGGAVVVRWLALRPLALGCLGVHRLGELVRGARQRIGGVPDAGRILRLEGLLGVGQRTLDRAPGARVEGATVLRERPLGLVDETVELVARVDQLALLAVLLGVERGLLDHAVDLVLGETARSRDLDRLLLARPEVLRVHVHDAVGIDVEGDLDLRYAARGGRDTDQVELPEELVVAGHLALTLEDADGHRRLVVGGGREDLALARRDGGVLLDQLGEDATQRLDAERERGHVEEQDVLHLALEDGTLDGRSDRDHLVGVDALVRLLPEELLDARLHCRHARHAAHQDHLVDVPRAEPGILERGEAGVVELVEQIGTERLELRPRELHVEVLRTALIGGDEGQVDVGLHRARQLDLGLLRGLLQPLERHAVLAEIDALILAELVR